MGFLTGTSRSRTSSSARSGRRRRGSAYWDYTFVSRAPPKPRPTLGKPIPDNVSPSLFVSVRRTSSTASASRSRRSSTRSSGAPSGSARRRARATSRGGALGVPARRAQHSAAAQPVRLPARAVEREQVAVRHARAPDVRQHARGRERARIQVADVRVALQPHLRRQVRQLVRVRVGGELPAARPRAPHDRRLRQLREPALGARRGRRRAAQVARRQAQVVPVQVREGRVAQLADQLAELLHDGHAAGRVPHAVLGQRERRAVARLGDRPARGLGR